VKVGSQFCDDIGIYRIEISGDVEQKQKKEKISQRNVWSGQKPGSIKDDLSLFMFDFFKTRP